MPHVSVEYTANLAADGDIPTLLKSIAAKLADSDGVFPLGGIRVRAIRLDEYAIADGADDYAFVHLTARIAAGRPAEFRQRFFGELFDLAKAHFAPLMETRLMALSLYVDEVDEAGSWKANTIHRTFKNR